MDTIDSSAINDMLEKVEDNIPHTDTPRIHLAPQEIEYFLGAINREATFNREIKRAEAEICAAKNAIEAVNLERRCLMLRILMKNKITDPDFYQLRIDQKENVYCLEPTGSEKNNGRSIS